MEIAIKERIGDPVLFTNRREDLDFFQSWIGRNEKEAAISTAITSNRKLVKTAMLQRLYNRLFEQGDKVITFLFEIEEQNRLLDEFSCIYYISFISQLLFFKWKMAGNALNHRGAS